MDPATKYRNLTTEELIRHSDHEMTGLEAHALVKELASRARLLLSELDEARFVLNRED